MVCGGEARRSPEGKPSRAHMGGRAMGGGQPAALAALFESGQAERNGMLLIKLQDTNGQFHRVHCTVAEGWAPLQAALGAKIGGEGGGALRGIVYTDDDGDKIVVDSDEGLREAAGHAWRHGLDRLQVRSRAREAGPHAAFSTPELRASRAPARVSPSLSCFPPRDPLSRISPDLARQVTLVSSGAELSPSGQTRVGGGRDGAQGGADAEPSGLRRWSPTRLGPRGSDEKLSAVSAFLGGLVAASSLAVGAGLMIAAKAAKR